MLKYVELFKDPHSGPYIDFIISDNKTEDELFSKQDPQFYLNIDVFSPLFIHCFEMGGQYFDLWGGCIPYNKDVLKKVVTKLEEVLKKLSKVDSKAELVAFSDQHHKEREDELLKNMEIENIDIGKDWKILVEKFKKVNNDLIDLALRCIEEEKVLWVCGT